MKEGRNKIKREELKEGGERRKEAGEEEGRKDQELKCKSKTNKKTINANTGCLKNDGTH